jgi:hypothetical protein
MIILLALYAITYAMLEWMPVWALRPIEGWLIPHRIKQQVCRFKCGTCKEAG